MRVIALVALFLMIIGIAAYGFRQIKGLKSRVTTVENRVNETYAYNEEGADEVVDIKVASHSTKQLRVETIYSMEGTPQYETKSVEEFIVRIKNNTSWQHNDGGAIQARTAKGVLISPATIHPDDFKGESTLSLAPGGEAEITLHFVAPEGEKITDIYTDGK